MGNIVKKRVKMLVFSALSVFISSVSATNVPELENLSQRPVKPMVEVKNEPNSKKLADINKVERQKKALVVIMTAYSFKYGVDILEKKCSSIPGVDIKSLSNAVKNWKKDNEKKLEIVDQIYKQLAEDLFPNDFLKEKQMALAFKQLPVLIENAFIETLSKSDQEKKAEFCMQNIQMIENKQVDVGRLIKEMNDLPGF